MSIRAIVLAAGKGTRMKSSTAKVLHELCGRPMLWYVIRALRKAGVEDILVVTNPELQLRIGEFGVAGVLQEEQLGTGHAVRIALDALRADGSGRMLVAYADMPLVPEDLFAGVLGALDGSNALALVTARVSLPSNFGRIVRKNGGVERIVEARDANVDELAIDEVNAGIYAFEEPALRESVARLRNDNAQKEYYLTDTVADFVRAGKRVTPVVAADPLHVLGINDRAELAQARREMNERICTQHMRDGVTIIDPGSTYLEPELLIGPDTVIYPNTTVSRLSEIGERCVIGPNSRLSNVRLGDEVTVRESTMFDSSAGDRASIGPFAHIRNEAQLGEDVRIGNFVEVKGSRLARGVKASHLTYIGDSEIGENTNIGAGTITCNYDGKRKNKTVIGRDVMIGSNTSLIAPVTIGDGALTGAGSVVTKDVAPGDRVAGNPAKPLTKK
ncbi:MAG TPA: bifunctional UDP-N-acetylglucosamine diphosphorylase/glucosamine-1-phosphate N-acetyltransferase GlmU [Candidatus Rubrimentiphilum sp.]|nr:bifunctional UDP-N-acetylglucosamine diphosphorylase/glucosamine-1-phosphate N-acetyltransferase GlmU [Candidatus Rubrimentiphilum sp.]